MLLHNLFAYIVYFICGFLIVSCHDVRNTGKLSERAFDRVGQSTRQSSCVHVQSTDEQTVIALSKFYISTQGQKYWNVNSSWLVGDPCLNEWYGVCCNNAGQVTELKLTTNGLNGSIPPEFYAIKSFEVIDFSINTLNGSLPDEIAMPFLSFLNLYGNSLAGPVQTVWNTPKLKFLHLAFNYFNGSLPKLYNLKELEVLDVSYNFFTGSLPVKYSYLSSLRVLRIQHNNFKAPNRIPYSWLKLKNMEEFSAEMLLGEIPKNIGFQWPNMKDFQILYGNLTGGLPRSICNWKNMMYLGITNNPLGGHIPDCIGNLKHLIRVYFTATQVGGTLPESLGNLKNLDQLDLYDNNLHGPIPSSMASLTDSLVAFEIFRNKLNSIDDSLKPLFESKIMTHCDVSQNPFPCPLPDFTKSCLISSCSNCNTEENRSFCSRCLRIDSSKCGWCSEGPSCIETDDIGNPVYDCKASDWYNGTRSCP